MVKRVVITTDSMMEVRVDKQGVWWQRLERATDREKEEAWEIINIAQLIISEKRRDHEHLG